MKDSKTVARLNLKSNFRGFSYRIKNTGVVDTG